METATPASALTGLKRLLAPRHVLYPEDRAQRRYYLLDTARGAAAFMILFWHYRHFFIDPYAPLAIGQAVAEPRADFGQLLPMAHLFSPFYHYGWAAVQLFWMISGFVFSSVYLGIPTTTRQFAVNRFARLYPLHLLTLCLVGVLQLLAVPTFGHPLFYPDNDPYHFVLHVFFASNWGLEGANPYSFNGPIWSVSVEVLIYAAFWLLQRWLTAAGIAVPLVLALIGGALAMAFGDNLIASCFFYFFLGSGVYGVCAAFSRTPKILVALALAAIAIAGGFFVMLRAASLAHFVLPWGFSGLIILLVVAERAVTPRWHKPLSVIGDNTYGMYLLHIPIQLALFLTIGRIFNLAELAQSIWFLLLFLALVVVLARVTFVYFEKPLRKRLRRWGHLSPRQDRPTISAP